MSTQKKVTVFGVGAVLALTGIALLTMLGSSDAQDAVAAEAGNAPDEVEGSAVRVEVAQPEQRPMTRSLRMPASLEAYEAADLYAKASGYVAEVLVDIGTRVKRGDALLTLDVPEMLDELAESEATLLSRQAAVAQARAQLETAHAEVKRCQADFELQKLTRDRKKQLSEQRAIPDQELDEAQGRLDMAEAQATFATATVAAREADVRAADAAVNVARAKLARVKTLMEYATVRAPFDGVITERFVHPGAFVRSAADSATTPLLSIARIGKLRLTLEIPESDAAFVRVGTGVEVLVPAVMDAPLTAEVSRVAHSLRPNTRTMPVEVDIANDDGALAPGMYAKVTVALETKAQALMIPSKAIRVRGSDITVLVADAGKAQSRPIKIGYDDGIWAEVKSGLSGDEQIIVSAAGVVAPGAPVAATPAGR
jgi:RND family efflux transporter MFP subunit